MPLAAVLRDFKPAVELLEHLGRTQLLAAVHHGAVSWGGTGGQFSAAATRIPSLGILIGLECACTSGTSVAGLLQSTLQNCLYKIKVQTWLTWYTSALARAGQSRSLRAAPRGPARSPSMCGEFMRDADDEPGFCENCLSDDRD